MLANDKLWSFYYKTCIQNDCHQWLSHSYRVHQIRFRPRLRPDPAGELTAFPRSPSWFKGKHTSKGKGLEGGKGGEERVRPLRQIPGSAPGLSFFEVIGIIVSPERTEIAINGAYYRLPPSGRIRLLLTPRLLSASKWIIYSMEQIIKPVVAEFWRKAKSPYCHPRGGEWIRPTMTPSNNNAFWAHMSQPPKRHLGRFSRFAWHVRMTNTQTDTQTTLRATSIAIDRIYDMHAMRSYNGIDLDKYSLASPCLNSKICFLIVLNFHSAVFCLI